MKIILKKIDGDEIVLKNCKSYEQLDKIIASFSSSGEIIEELGLDIETTDIIILDNNGGQIDFNPGLLNIVLSYYEQNKGDEFIKWIYDSSVESPYGEKNKSTLYQFFNGRLLSFTKDEKSDSTDINDINNPEGKRLYNIISDIIEKLNFYGGEPKLLEQFEDQVIPFLREYVKTQKGEYSYTYMRKFAVSLAKWWHYYLKEPTLELRKTSDSDKKKIINEFETVIHNYEYPKKQVTFDEIIKQSEKETKPIYDENGIKLEEKEFLEEFTKKYTL